MTRFRPFAVVVVCAVALGMNGCASRRSNLDFSLTNLTDATLRYVYVSPSASGGWEENLLAGSELKSGDTIQIRFNPNETATMWDLRIEGGGVYHAEWKNLSLADISEIRLFREDSPQLEVIAEIE